MAMIKDTVTITRSGKPLPDVTKNELSVNAWLVWEVAKAYATKGGATRVEERSHEGAAGYVWHGAMTSIFRELWSGMLDSYTGDKATVIAAKKALGTYLRQTSNMVCLDRGIQSPLPNAQETNRLPTWWVRAEWNAAPPVVHDHGVIPTRAERKLTPAEAGEDRVPAPVEVKKVTPAAMPPRNALERTDTAPHAPVSWEERRAAILDAAVTLLRERGEEGVTKSEVAALAGVGDGTLYQFFKNMDDLRDEANAVLQAEADVDPLTCPRCGRTFAATQGLTSHLTTHVDGAFPCRRPECEAKFTSSQGRTNHENAHATRDRFLEATVQLILERGDAIDAFGNQEIANRAGVTYAENYYRHFTDKADLMQKARDVIADRGLVIPTVAPTTALVTTPVTAVARDETTIADIRHKVFSIAAFAASVGAPMSFSAIRGLVNGVNLETRAEVLTALVADGKLHVATVKDVKNRDVDVYLPVEPVDFSAPAVSVDPVAVIQELVADYERLRKASGQESEATKVERLARRAAEDEADGLKEELEGLKDKMRSFASFLNGA